MFDFVRNVFFVSLFLNILHILHTLHIFILFSCLHNLLILHILHIFQHMHQSLINGLIVQGSLRSSASE